jgi:RepB DNA-primase from phage plasmid
MHSEIADNYIRENFEPGDRLAVVVLHKRSGTVTQRLATAEKIAAVDFQAWLRQKNAERHEIYVSMNTLREDATGRTKGDIAGVRHIYLDFDDDGTAAVERLLKRDDLPQPNYVVNSSPGKWQVIWKVEGFTKEQAETLQRSLARETGADPAATDCARVLRLPGFYNHKYARRHWVGVESLSREIYGPDRFPKLPEDERGLRLTPPGSHGRKAKNAPGHVTQSERDWAYAKRALARGESEDIVIAAIANYRRFDKHNPQYYAELTVRKAAGSLAVEGAADMARTEGRDR